MKRIKHVLSDKELQETARVAGSRASEKDESEADESVNGEQLEKAYRNVPALYNAINKYYQTIMSRDRRLVGPNADFYKEWLNSVGEIGGKETWPTIHSKIYKYQGIYGEAYVEIINDAGTDRPVDLATVDPKRMDYAKEGTGDGHGSAGSNIALDRFGNPQGYVQHVDNYDGDRVDQVYDVPSNISVSNNEIYIPARNMIHLKFQEVGDGFHPSGMIDPVFRDAERSFELKQDYADTAHINLFPTRVSYVGDDTHEATPEKINRINAQQKQAKNSTEWTFPNYVDVEMLEADNPDALIDFFNHFNSEIAAGTGMPEAVVMGDGANVNRATLGIIDSMFQISLRDVVQRTSREIEKQLFENIAKAHGHEDYPEFSWDIDVPFGYKGEPDTDNIDPGNGSPVTSTGGGDNDQA